MNAHFKLAGDDDEANVRVAVIGERAEGEPAVTELGEHEEAEVRQVDLGSVPKVKWPCEGYGCTISGARLRRCTGERLCISCRQKDDYAIISETYLTTQVPWLPRSLWPAPAGDVVNSRHPGFARQRVYRWADVLARCARWHLPEPIRYSNDGSSR